jgi:hypothetical protein
MTATRHINPGTRAKALLAFGEHACGLVSARSTG